MEAAGVALAIPGVIDLCLRYGSDLYKRCNDYRDADIEVREAIFCVQYIWRTVQSQIETLREHWNELPADLQIHQNSFLTILQYKIQLVLINLDELIGSRGRFISLTSILKKRGDVKKLKYATATKEMLKANLNDLEKWQTRFDRSWLLLSMIPSHSLDDCVWRTKHLDNGPVAQMHKLRSIQRIRSSSSIPSSSVFLDSSIIGDVDGENSIAFSDAFVTTIADGNSQQTVIVDGAPHLMTKTGVRSLALNFSGVDPTITSLLPCKGVVEKSSGFHFVFEIPQQSGPPQTLRAALLRQQSNYTLTERMKLVTYLAQHVLFLHQAHFVHKNIRPETIIFLSSAPNDNLGQPFLVGFQEIRGEDEITLMRGDDLQERNIYRHPKRQGLTPQNRYVVQHDIYSLGVCLLEIGLWEPFVNYNLIDSAAKPVLNEKVTNRKPFELKQEFLSLAKARLPSLMGDIYTMVVVSCLTCLDADNEAFGSLNEMADQDGIVIGVRYIEKILEKLDKISV
ncbi:Het-s domain protein [Neofusicoccum parvum]|uniref:Het-s domain protein n=1 Tax=Neofusicoccum parvum TaxID=310453 RepID=A0ACB5SN21_9PEZI|nr:Het-s domain protein [Neofusicoccum parvum]